MNNQTCDKCRWWGFDRDHVDGMEPNQDSVAGCHRFPPQFSDAMLIGLTLYQAVDDEHLTEVADWQTLWERATEEQDEPTNSVWPPTRADDFCGEFTPTTPNISDEVGEKSIDTLSISARTRNALHRVGIHSIKELTKETRFEILNIRNIGVRGLQEIEAELSAKEHLTLRERKNCP